jgi:deazaflavin-dependent oxidoreductase (nitroreductase family)
MMRAFNPVSVRLYRLTGGRSMRLAGLLTTIGARSGKERTVTVGVIPDGASTWFVVAAHSGAARHPAWFINLANHPDQVWVEIGKDRFKVRPELLHGEERADAWQRIVQKAPAYGKVEHTTDREIPVVRLTREPSPS